MGSIELEQELIDAIPKGKGEKIFDVDIYVKNSIMLLSFYVCKGSLIITEGIEGTEYDFLDYSLEDQIIIYNAIMGHKYS